MSVDIIIITPSNYTLNTFFERIPFELDPGILDDGRIVVVMQNRGVWIDNWVNSYPTLEDVYDEEQLKVINGIDSPQF